MSYKSTQSNQKYSDRVVWKPENEGDELEGVLINIDHDVVTKNGPVSIAHINGLDGIDYSVFLSAGLVRQITDALEGEQLKIVYQGKQVNEKSGRTFNAYDVQVWSDDSEEDDEPETDIPF